MATAIGSRSPATSPRLPSPPPFPEVQLPPKSPGMPVSPAPGNVDSAKLESQSLRRIRPGTKAADMVSGPSLVPLSELDSPFQLQEHLKALYTHHTRPVSSPDTTQPVTSATALEIATPPPNVDRSLWLYELTRFLVMRANDLIVSFFRETPPCSAATCPEMRASEWQYLCAVHEPPKPCCAIDYSCHTLDWAAYILTSQKHFPSRLTLGNEASGGTQQGVRQLTNIIRRVYRIFAHAWFQHRSVFLEVEGREGLYILYKTVCDVYGLIPEENYTIPREAEGSEDEVQDVERPRQRSPEKAAKPERAEDDQLGLTASTTMQRRHKATPSVGSAVATIQEDEEDKGESPSKEQQNGFVGQGTKAGPQSIPSVPLAAISKTAEKKDAPSLAEERKVKAMSKGGDSAPESQSQDAKEGIDASPPQGSLARSSSADSVATMVKIEEKESEYD